MSDKIEAADSHAHKIIAEAIDATFMQRGFNGSRHATVVLETLKKAGYVLALPSQGEIARVPRAPRFALGDQVRKIKGSSWRGRVVGFYSTALTPVGCCVESEHEPGSVQIYPDAALEATSLSAPQAQGWLEENQPLNIEKLVKRCDNFRAGARRLYESEPNKGDMWFFELFHHLGDCADAMLAASPPHPSASRGKVEEKKEVSGSRL